MSTKKVTASASMFLMLLLSIALAIFPLPDDNIGSIFHLFAIFPKNGLPPVVESFNR